MHKRDAAPLFKKAKKQKTAAWILLAGGVGLFIVGESIIVNEGAKEFSNNLGASIGGIITLGYGYTPPPKVTHSTIAPVMVYSGIGAMLGSIPLFIASHKNKREARLILKDETVFFNPQLNIKEHLFSLGIKINL